MRKRRQAAARYAQRHGLFAPWRRVARVGQRQLHDETGPCIDVGIHADVTGMGARNRARNGQAETGTVRARGVKGFEYLFDFFRVDTGAVVVEDQRQRAFGTQRSNADPSLTVACIKTVFDEIE